MDAIFNFIKSRKLWYFMTFGAVVAAIIALIVYLTSGPTQYDPDYSTFVIVGLCVSVPLGVTALIKPFKPLLYGQYLFAFMALLGFFTSHANLYGNLFMALDGAVIPASFFIIAILLLASTAVSLAAAIMMKGKEATENE